MCVSFGWTYVSCVWHASLSHITSKRKKHACIQKRGISFHLVSNARDAHFFDVIWVLFRWTWSHLDEHGSHLDEDGSFWDECCSFLRCMISLFASVCALFGKIWAFCKWSRALLGEHGSCWDEQCLFWVNVPCLPVISGERASIRLFRVNVHL